MMSNKPFTLAMIALLVSIGAVVFVSVVKSTTGSSEYFIEAVNEDVCVNCVLLDDQDPEVKPLIQSLMTEVEEGGGKKCCVQTLDSLQVILKLVSAKAPVSDIPTFAESADLPFNGVLAHKRLLPPNENSYATGATTMIPLSLTPEEDTGELSNNVLVTPHGIIILHTGLYRVYVSIRFRRGPDRPCGYRNVTTWHYGVVRSRPNDRQQSGNILYAPHTCCKNCSTENETSYTAGMFILQAGDHLHVEVSTPGLVLFDKTSSFLGLHMMGEQGNG